MATPDQLKTVAVLLISVATFAAAAMAPSAANRIYLLNYDIEIVTAGNDGNSAGIQQQGIRFSPQGQIHGKDLGHYDYIFSLSELTDEGGRLTIEVFHFESREKSGEPVSEYISVIDFEFGMPVQVEAETDGFSVDLALTIGSRSATGND